MDFGGVDETFVALPGRRSGYANRGGKESWLVRQFWTTRASAFTISNDDERRAFSDARSFTAGGLREFVFRSKRTRVTRRDQEVHWPSHAGQSSIVVHGRSRLSGTAAV